MDKDRLINLLPEEYLPEPEFKAFPIFAAVLILATLAFVWLQFQADRSHANTMKARQDKLVSDNKHKIEEAKEFTDIQANSRFIASYLAIIPNMVLQAPDYWEIYNEVERLLPEDTWVSSMTFRGHGTGWPDVIIECVSRGYGFGGPLNTYDHLKGTNENPTRFNNIRMGGYQRANVGGAPGVVFQIQVGVRYPTEKELARNKNQ